MVELLTNAGGRPTISPTNQFAINELQWVAYLLDQFSTVEQAERSFAELDMDYDTGMMHHLVV